MTLLKKLFSPTLLYNSIVYRIACHKPNLVPDKAIIKAAYRLEFKRKLNLRNPQTYNEKLQWMKLNYRLPIMTELVDKYRVKEYIAKKIGNEYIIPLLGVWKSFDEIDFEKLPQKFVLKTTHDSGGIVIVRDKNKLDKDKARSIIEKSLKTDYYLKTREWPYKNVVRRIIAEKYMEDEYGELRDYKFFCFDGVVKGLFIATDRQTKGEETKFDFFDADFNHLPIKNGHPNASKTIQKPILFEEMKAIAEKLSKDFPHVRVDLYLIKGKIYFGELTFFHFNGMVPFEPEEWDYKLGEWFVLPT